MIGGDAGGAVALAAVFGIVIGVAEFWQRHGGRAEATRKLVHLGGGIACLAFPLLVRSPWVVLVLALGMATLFAAGRRWGFLTCLHRVTRRTRGTEYYPCAIFVLFLLARDRPWLYVSSVLVLAVADAGAALIGGRFGRLRYTVEDEQKSVEGSVAFLVIAFVAASVPALVMTALPAPVCVLAALLAAVLLTGFEAISLEGTDNLFVPLATCVLLERMTAKPLAEILFQNASLALLAAGIGVAVWRSRALNVGGAITFGLAAYGAWALGSAWWGLPVLTGFALYVCASFMMPLPRGAQSTARVRSVFQAMAGPTALLVAANASGREGVFYAAFVGACGCVLSFSLWNRAVAYWHLRPLWRSPGAAAAAVLGWAATAGTAALAPAVASGRVLMAVLGVVVVASLVHDRHPDLGAGDCGPGSWSALRMLLTLAAAGIILLSQTRGWLPGWVPPR